MNWSVTPTGRQRDVVSQHLISVVLPVCNAQRYLEAAVRSIFRQTWHDWEMILVDDGSDDDSAAIAGRLADEDRRLRVVRQDRGGVTAALNHGLTHASGDLIARMDADDVALPHRFQKQIDFLDAHPEVIAVGTNVYRVDADGDPIGVGKWPLTHDQIDTALLTGHGGLAHPTAMIRHSALRAVGGYRTEFTVAQDKDLWMRLAEQGYLANVPEPLLMYREHLASIGSRFPDQQRDMVRRAVEEARRRRGLSCVPAFRSRISDAANVGHVRICATDRRHDWIRTAIRHGHLRTARKHAGSLLADYPVSATTWLTLFRFLSPLRC